jgi:hypothetical protein
MSIVQITDGHGRLAWWAPLRIVALLAHPDDEAVREELFEVLVASWMIAEQAEEARDPIVVQMASGRLDRAFSGVGGGCAIAGDLLLWILSAAYHQPQHASVRRAVTVWARDNALAKDHAGHPVPASPRTVKAIWARYKPIAHLCGAWQIHHRDLGGQSQLDPTDNATLINFLGAAETLRIHGQAHHPPIGRTGSKPGKLSLLDPATTWRCPLDLTLPTVPLTVPPVTDWSREWLADYQSHRD